jgi:hypothetical protein
MEIITTIGSSSIYVAAFILAVFVWCFIAVASAVYKKSLRLIVAPVVLLVSSVVLVMASKRIVLYQLSKMAVDNEISITITPSTEANPRVIYRELLDNLYSFKGKSGSHPTELTYIVTLCDKNSLCAKIELGQDSREENIYWVSYKSYKYVTLPLGFVRLESSVFFQG